METGRFAVWAVRGLALLAWPMALCAAVGDISYIDGIGGKGSTAEAINDAGVVVGRSYDSASWWHLIRFAPGGAVEDLGRLSGGHTVGYGINNGGMIVGWGGADAGYSGGEAYQYSGSGPFVPLGFLDGFSYASGAQGINDAGVIVGASQTSNGVTRAFRKAPAGQMENLGTLGGLRSWARDINGDGVIVGAATTADGRFHGFRYMGNGPMVKLDDLTADSDSYAEGVNASGAIVGYGTFPLDPRTHQGDASEDRALRWDGSGQVYELAHLPNWTDSQAYAINDAGVSVGQGIGPAGQRALLWQSDGTVVDLNAWLASVNPAAGANWTLLAANDINSSGQMVGYGQYDDGPGGRPDGVYAYVLDVSSVPEPAFGMVGVVGLSIVVLRRRARPTPQV